MIWASSTALNNFQVNYVSESLGTLNRVTVLNTLEDLRLVGFGPPCNQYRQAHSCTFLETPKDCRLEGEFGCFVLYNILNLNSHGLPSFVKFDII